MTAQITTLANGLRVATDRIDTVDTVSLGIWVDVGTRQNRHQSLRALSAMAYAVTVAATRRFHPEAVGDGFGEGALALPPLDPAGAMELRPVATEERPPLRSLAAAAEPGGARAG